MRISDEACRAFARLLVDFDEQRKSGGEPAESGGPLRLHDPSKDGRTPTAATKRRRSKAPRHHRKAA
jgi:hypothetical protein